MSRLLRIPMMWRGLPTGDRDQKQLSFLDTWDAYLQDGIQESVQQMHVGCDPGKRLLLAGKG